MAKDKNKVLIGAEGLEESKIAMENLGFPNGIGVADVELEASESSPYHKPGSTYHAHKTVADIQVKRGWAKIVSIMLLMFASFGAMAQASVYASLYNATNTYTLARLNAATAVIDTVTNTGTGVLTTKKMGGPGTVTIWIAVTKTSGTVGGTITLKGSLDGTNFKALNTQDTQTALATITPTDATNTYHWRLGASPFLYYQVSWAGAGTMVATFTAQILKH